MERYHVLFVVVLATVLRCGASMPIQSNAVGIEFMSENHLSRTSNEVSRSLRSNEISSERTLGGNLKAGLLQKNLNEWFAKHYSIGDVFDRLNLKYVGQQQNVFNEPMFLTWLKYADDVNTRDGNAAASMISILKSRFGTVRLTNMIQGGKTVGKSKHVAAKFEGLLIDDWKKFDYSADDVFQLLRLDNGLDGILSNPSWEIWLRYVDNLNLQNSPVLNILRVHYDDDNLFRMLSESMKMPSVSHSATILESQLKQAIRSGTKVSTPELEQMKIWKHQGLLSDDFNKALHLQDYDDFFDVLMSPKWNAWIRYVDDVAPNADKGVATLKELLRRFGVNHVAEGIAASTSSERPLTREVGQYLEVLLFNKWAAGAVDPEKVRRIAVVYGNPSSPEFRAFVARYTARLKKAK